MKLTTKNLLALGLFPLIVFILDYSFWRLAPEWSFRWSIDTPLHFLGGMSIATASTYGYQLLEKSGALIIRNRLLKIALIASVVALSAVLWEISELARDYWFGTHSQANNEDTMKDLILGLMGGIIWGAISIRHAPKK